MHPEASVQNLDYIKSDHRPKKKRFEAKWLQEKGFQEKVQQT
jgi:hypothetical protein